MVNSVGSPPSVPAADHLITAFPEESLAKGAQSGAVCFLSEPFDGAALIESIDIALRKRDCGEQLRGPTKR